jgi:hypothetical protein
MQVVGSTSCQHFGPCTKITKDPSAFGWTMHAWQEQHFSFLSFYFPAIFSADVIWDGHMALNEPFYLRKF